VIITRPPEIIACLKLVIKNRNIFIIFDSHSRPSHPDGAGFILNTSIHRTAARLSELLPMDNSLLSDSSLQWQAQLLANYSGHIFVSRGLGIDPDHLMQTVIESSLAILALRARISDLESRNSSLTSENKRLEAEMEQIEDEHREEQRRILQSSRDHGPKAHPLTPPTGNTVAGLQTALHSHRPPGSSHQMHKNLQTSVSVSSSNNYGDIALAEQMQLDWVDSDRHNAEAAARRQKQFDEEDRVLRAERAELAKHTEGQFQCGVCLDDQPKDYGARLDPCGHRFCRDCIRSYVGSKLDENRYPILCPVCMTEVKGDPGGTLSCSFLGQDILTYLLHVSVVTSFLVQQIGISEKQYETWTELQMVEFSVLLHCRK
jgi:hypothetical protein